MAQTIDSAEAERAARVASIESMNKQNLEEGGLELSDGEKALIMNASSLTASPQEIMAAMKLAAKKEKMIESPEREEEEPEAT